MIRCYHVRPKSTMTATPAVRVYAGFRFGSLRWFPENIMTRTSFLFVAGAIAFPLFAQKPGPYAQKLVDEALTKHPDVVILVMHVTPPGSAENVIVASNIGRYGKKADEDDLRVIETGKPNLEVNAA